MYGIKRLAEVEKKDGFLFRLDTRVKIAFLAYGSIFSMILDSVWALTGTFAFSVFLALGARLDWGKVKALGFMVILITWGTIFSQAIFYYQEPRTVLFCLVEQQTPFLGSLLGEVSFYTEGMEYGAIQSLRFSFMLVLGMTYCWTTDSGEMFRGMLRLKAPFIISFMTVTAVRFLPVLIDEFSMVILACRMRGGRLLSLNPWRMATAWLKIIRPVLLNCYRRSNVLALSLQGRGFSPENRPGLDLEQGLTQAQWVLVLAGGGVTFLVLAAKGTYWLYVTGLFYSSELRRLYEFTRLYL